MFQGPRTELRELFELAEDSAAALDAYIDHGDVLVAYDGEDVIGHLLLVLEESGQAEIKNMAVRPSHQRQGIGRGLVETAVQRARHAGASIVEVATATADTGNLRFYQRVGFRFARVERDAFTPQTGYEVTEVDGMPLRDRLWLDLEL